MMTYDEHVETTDVERTVLVLIAQGLSDGDIAHRLGIEPAAARSRVARFRERTGLAGRGLAVWCARHRDCCLQAEAS